MSDVTVLSECPHHGPGCRWFAFKAWVETASRDDLVVALMTAQDDACHESGMREQEKADHLAALERVRVERAKVLDALRSCVIRAQGDGVQDGAFIARYTLPTGPIHRAITLLGEMGIHDRPGFDSIANAEPVAGSDA